MSFIHEFCFLGKELRKQKQGHLSMCILYLIIVFKYYIYKIMLFLLFD